MRITNQPVTLADTLLEAHIRTTQLKNRTGRPFDSLAQRQVPTEVPPGERQYAVLRFKSERTGAGHRLIPWDVDHLSKRPIA